MNTYFNRLVAAICIAMIFVLNNTSSFAGNYTWTGNTSSAWSVSSNWSPSGVPGTNDTVTIGSGSDTIVLASNRTISRLVINGRTLNLGDYELEVSQKATLSGGIIYNGTLKLRGALVTFSGTHTDCLIDCITGQLEFNGGVFDGEGSFE